MLPFQVRRFEGRRGEEVVLLTRRSGLPHFYPNLFATSDYRNPGRSPNTIVKVLRSIGLAQMWAAMNGRDLDEDLYAGPFLSVVDADDLASFLGLVTEEQERRYMQGLDRTSPAPSKVVRLEEL